MIKRIVILIGSLLPSLLHAQGGSELYLVQLRDQPQVTRITNRPGYDNQPSFAHNLILYTSIDSAGRADIWRYDPATSQTAALIRTNPESEYSATLMPRGDRISVVRVEQDSTQRLWSFALDGSDPRIVLESIKPVGYHAWLDSSRVALFVLGSPNTLQIADVRTGSAQRITENIGRALQKVPGRNAISFVQTDPDSTRWIKAYDVDAGTITPLVRTFPENEYHVWTRAGRLITARGSVLYEWDRSARDGWKQIADTGVQGITRLAITPDGRQLVVVGAEPN